MEYKKRITLKDGRACILRNGTEKDGKAALDNFILTHEQTDNLLTYPDESDITADQELYLGDKVEVIFERLGINTTARVKKYEFDSLRERYKKVEIGTIKPSITKSLAAVFKKTGVKIR